MIIFFFFFDFPSRVDFFFSLLSFAVFYGLWRSVIDSVKFGRVHVHDKSKRL